MNLTEFLGGQVGNVEQARQQKTVTTMTCSVVIRNECMVVSSSWNVPVVDMASCESSWSASGTVSSRCLGNEQPHANEGMQEIPLEQQQMCTIVDVAAEGRRIGSKDEGNVCHSWHGVKLKDAAARTKVKDDGHMDVDAFVNNGQREGDGEGTCGTHAESTGSSSCSQTQFQSCTSQR